MTPKLNFRYRILKYHRFLYGAPKTCFSCSRLRSFPTSALFPRAASFRTCDASIFSASSSSLSSLSFLPLCLVSPSRFTTVLPYALQKQSEERRKKKVDGANMHIKEARSILEWYSKQKECGVLSSSDVSFLLPKIRRKSGLTLPLPTLPPLAASSSRCTTTSIAVSPLTQLACMALGAEDRSFSALSCSSASPSSSTQESGVHTAAAELNRDFFFSLTVKEKEELAVFFLYRLGRIPEGIHTNEIFDALLDAPHIDVIPRFLQEALFAEPSFLNHVHPKYLKRCFELALSPLPAPQETGTNIHDSYRDVNCSQERKKQWIAWAECYLPSHHERCVTLRKAGLWYEVMAYEHYALSCFSSSPPLPTGSSVTQNGETVNEPLKQNKKETEEKQYRRQKTTLYRRLLCSPLGWGRSPWEGKGTERVNVQHIFTGGFGPEMMALLSHPEVASDAALTRLFRPMPPIILDYSVHLLLLSWARRSRLRRAVRHTSLGRCCGSTDAVRSSQNGRGAELPARFPNEEHEKSNKDVRGDSCCPILLPTISDDGTANEKTAALPPRLDLPRALSHAPSSSSASSFGVHLPEWLVKNGYFTRQSLLETMHYDLQEGSSWTAQGLLHRCHHRDAIAMLMQHTLHAGMEVCWQSLTHWRKLFPNDTVYLVLRLPQACKAGNKKHFRSTRKRSAVVTHEKMVSSHPFTLILQLVPSTQNGLVTYHRTTPSPSSSCTSLSFHSLSASSFHDFRSASSASTPPWPTSPATTLPSSFSSAVATAAAAAAVVTSSLLPPPIMKPLLRAATSEHASIRGSTPTTGKSMSSILRGMPSVTSDMVEWSLAVLLQPHTPPAIRRDGGREVERQEREEEEEEVLEREAIASGVRHCGKAVVRALDTAEVKEVLEVLMVAVERRITVMHTEILVDVLLSLATCGETPLRSSHHTGETSTSFRSIFSETTYEGKQTCRSGKECGHSTADAQRESNAGKTLLAAITSPTSTAHLRRVARLYPEILLPNGAEVVFQTAVRRAWRRYEDELQKCHESHVEEEAAGKVRSTPAPIPSFPPSSKCFLALFRSSSSPITLGRLLHVSLQCGFFLGPAEFLSSLSRSLVLASVDVCCSTTAERGLSGHSLCPTTPSLPSAVFHPPALPSSSSAVFRVWRDVLEEMLLQRFCEFPSACSVSHDERYHAPLPCHRHPHAVRRHLPSTSSPQSVGEDAKAPPFHRSFSSSPSEMTVSSLESLLQLLRELFPRAGEGVANHNGIAVDEDSERKSVSSVEMDVFLYDASAVSPSLPLFSKEDQSVFSPIDRTDLCSSCCWWFSSDHTTVPHPFTTTSSSPIPCPFSSARHPASSARVPRVSTARAVQSRTQDAENALRMPSVTDRLYRHRRCPLWALALQDVRHRYHQWVTYKANMQHAMTSPSGVSQRRERKRMHRFTRDEGGEGSRSGIREEEWSAFFAFSWRLTRDIHKAVRLACVGLGYEASPPSGGTPQDPLHVQRAGAEEGGGLTPLPSALRTIFTSAEEWLAELQKSIHFLCSSPKTSSYLSHRLQRSQDTMLQWTIFTAADVLRQKKYCQEATTWFLPQADHLPVCLQRLRRQCVKESRDGVGRKDPSASCSSRDRDAAETFSHEWEEVGYAKGRTPMISRWTKKRRPTHETCVSLSRQRSAGGKKRCHSLGSVQERACGRLSEGKALNSSSPSVVFSRLKRSGKRNTEGDDPPRLVCMLLAELTREGNGLPV